ncbi:Caspase domain protein [Rosistilla ulvae]|uniref:Caspase domain protein n=2 Tax=Rosistilla ulvae TaxID=1930277 RepID=A0A517M8N0_9BACT|nr:Caspase domain protein [Rosistilla ulvae]
MNRLKRLARHFSSWLRTLKRNDFSAVGGWASDRSQGLKSGDANMYRSGLKRKDWILRQKILLGAYSDSVKCYLPNRKQGIEMRQIEHRSVALIRSCICNVILLALLGGLPCNADSRRGGVKPLRYRQQHAVIVGINYDSLDPDSQIEVPRLETAEQDAQAVRDMLVDHYGFADDNVHLLLGQDATLQKIRSQFGSEFLGDPSIVHEDDSVLVFYAGHGVRQQRYSQKEEAYVGMLYPSDLHVIEGKGVDPVSCLRIDDMMRMLQDYCLARHKLVILDSCHSGEVFNFHSSRSAGVNRGLRETLFHAPALQAIAAAQATQVAADSVGASDHSPFTSVLLDALKHGPGAEEDRRLFTASELFAFIPRRIRQLENVRQDPRGGWLDGEGDFYFFPTGLEVGAAEMQLATSAMPEPVVATVPAGQSTSGRSYRWFLVGIAMFVFAATALLLRRMTSQPTTTFASTQPPINTAQPFPFTPSSADVTTHPTTPAVPVSAEETKKCLVFVAGANWEAHCAFGPEAVFGRDPNCSFTLPGASRNVSNQHSRVTIDRQNQSIALEDLNSRHGTTVDDQPISGKRQLNSGEHVELANEVRLLFQTANAEKQQFAWFATGEGAEETSRWCIASEDRMPLALILRDCDRSALPEEAENSGFIVDSKQEIRWRMNLDESNDEGQSIGEQQNFLLGELSIEVHS